VQWLFLTIFHANLKTFDNKLNQIVSVSDSIVQLFIRGLGGVYGSDFMVFRFRFTHVTVFHCCLYANILFTRYYISRVGFRTLTHSKICLHLSFHLLVFAFHTSCPIHHNTSGRHILSFFRNSVFVFAYTI